MKAENGELRQNLAKLRKELEDAGEQSNETTENQLTTLRKAKMQLEAKCAEQVLLGFQSYDYYLKFCFNV